MTEYQNVIKAIERMYSYDSEKGTLTAHSIIIYQARFKIADFLSREEVCH